MFLDLRNEWPSVPPNRPEPRRPRLNKTGQRVVGLVLAYNILFLLIAPIAGSSVIVAGIAFFSAMFR
ncbi:hypothetical protein Y88_1722 [Novosphingobium nitrogenifigens DSM 19370]|uniref:Uncharacterized protein n=1 Tax=Novosphingobium nitrogenifigens DSM 19370 TaxID=983920 RepID=F1Z3M0_9SPHN|nr:hypothetical protein [Novosphingobium nitrogenifigens]EGD60834.1 hypothetical protein Y88_1722 [Novosphingobium nitrogenifigens DSM 19370]